MSEMSECRRMSEMSGCRTLPSETLTSSGLTLAIALHCRNLCRTTVRQCRTVSDSIGLSDCRKCRKCRNNVGFMRPVEEAD